MMSKRLLEGGLGGTTTTVEGVKRAKLSVVDSVSESLRNLSELEEGEACERVVSVLRQFSRQSASYPTLLESAGEALRKRNLSPLVTDKLWCLIGRCLRSIPSVNLCPFISLAKEASNSVFMVERRHGVSILGEYGEEDALGVAVKALGDSDGRIRFAALEAVIGLATRVGLTLPESVYSDCIKLAEDDCAKVRKLNLRLISLLGRQTPERKVYARGIETHEKINLVDDAFGWTCQAINDPCYQVREAAALALGTFRSVSRAFLLQTLEKNLMSNLRRVHSFNERAKGEFGEFASGRKFEADKAVRGEVEDDNNAISRGACGAFVHGLEDEFRLVRNASIRSLATLAKREESGVFARAAMDCLVDMLNDEIEQVRLEAINSCCGLASKVPVLLEDQLGNVLTGCLPDARDDIRHSTHRLLGSCSLLSRDSLLLTVEELLKSLAKYPGDQKSIYGALRDLGKNHPNFVAALTPKLLDIHPFFDTRETDISNVDHAAKMILILNASKLCSSLSQFFPPFVARHYSYLRDVYPDLVPRLDFFDSDKAETTEGNSERSTLDYLLARVKDINSSKGGLTAVLESLRRVKSMDLDHDQKQAVEVHSSFLQLQSLLRTDNQGLTTSPYRLRQCVTLADKLLHCYVGFSNVEILSIEQLKLRSLCSLLNAQKVTGKGNFVSPSHIHDSIKRIESLLKSDATLTADKFASTIISQCGHITRTSLLLAFIGKLIKEETDLKVITSNSIRGVKASIHHPAPTATFKWTVGIGQSVKVRGSYRGPMSPVGRLCIRVKYGIDDSGVFNIRQDELDQIDDEKWSFETVVRLCSNKVWSPSVKLDMQLCWTFDQSCFLGEIEGNPENNLLQLDVRSYEGTSRNSNSVVNLC